ncbi:uncharacterized protein PGTG_04538 [Puccinia graminis f. sp. tritici CRL 75-36-700-3]|uniref:Ketoreductase domain-containing protein n=1 Tax=Puccinia graminis f. sp. tritici (strain CRL 75-36-700-3 / race SCCL) TaxID=418459 RepID=E3K2L3_PUCGT|nr:uncharacterized protein PGTG_04538 [Puccinia graminis f. sp. tritici CRL 75-36-700-3]EFP78582.2 hypothetical protein PGTG_04538 [Puccinia graminis f. sp. tritici CRL 75-36-700-3]
MSAIRRPTIILTGGSRGIGLSCLEFLLKSPIRANVVSLSRSFPQRLQELKNLHHDNLLVVKGDVKNDEDNKLAVESAIKTFGSIDGLILNSGIIHFERIDSNKTLDAWREVFEVNFFALISMLKHSLVHLRDSKGRVVFISSTASVLGVSSLGSYGASKAALNSLCRTLAAEEPEITSVSLRPGVTDTEMQEELRSKGKGLMTPEVYQSCYDLFASSQIVQPDQPAEVIANLAVRADQNLTGQFFAWDDEELKSYRSSC